MTLRAAGFHLICDRCTRAELVPALTEAYARELEPKLGWHQADDKDYCADCWPAVCAAKASQS